MSNRFLVVRINGAKPPMRTPGLRYAVLDTHTDRVAAYRDKRAALNLARRACDSLNKGRMTPEEFENATPGVGNFWREIVGEYEVV